MRTASRQSQTTANVDHREGQFEEFSFADHDADDRADAGGDDADDEHLLPGPAELLVMDRGENDRADRAHGAGLRRRRQAQHHGAQHNEDQHGRGNDAEQAFTPERPARQRPRVLGHRRHVIGLEDAEQERVAGEQKDLENRRAPGAKVHIADRFAELVGEHDQHKRGRHQLRDGARGRQHAGDITYIVAVADHHRHRDQRHGDDLGRHRAGDRAEDEAHDDDGIAEAAANRTEQLAHRIQHVFGQAASFQDRAHEREEGDR